MNFKFLCKTGLYFFSFLLFISILKNPLYAAFSDNEKISVRIEQYIGDKQKLSISLLGDYKINGVATKYKKFTISLKDNGLYLDGDKKNYKEIIVTPLKEDSTHLITLDDKYSYIGDIIFLIESKVLDKKTQYYIQPINKLSIGNYLIGVVPNEMPSKWNIEALKSQTVAARTYTHAKKNSKLFDDTVNYQAYLGYKYDADAISAVNKTKNEVLLYNGRLVETFYSSSNGGYINSSKDYGWAQLDYSVAKCDPYDPLNYFESTVSKNTIISKVLKDDTIKKVNSVTFSKLGSNGRPSEVIFDTDKGVKKVSINKFRNSLDYNTLKNTLINISSFDGENLVLKGYGWGHGVGMSQYGAKKMAEEGLGYKSILGFYFPNTVLNGEKLFYNPSKKCNSLKEIKVTNTIINKNSSTTNNSVKVSDKVVSTPSTNTLKYKYTVNTKSSPLSLRQKANTSSKILVKIPKGKEVTYISGPTKGWYKVSYNKKTGYVSSEFIKKTTVNTPSTKPIINTAPTNSNNTSNKTNIKTTTTSSVSKTYKVVSGDTLYKISKKFSISVSEIKKMNNLKSDVIKLGQVLKVKN